MTVALEGVDHDKMIFAGNVDMDPVRIKVFTDALAQEDPDFWNRLRYLNFRELELAGTNLSKTFGQADFTSMGQNYDAFVSNTASIYATAGNQSSFFSKDDGINPEMQKTMRARLAEECNGSMSSIYKSFQVRRIGTNDDILVFECPDLDEKGMTGILKSFNDDKDGNFFDGLTAMEFSEFDLEANNYRRTISRIEFAQWGRNYDKYMAELHKVVGQMSDAIKYDASTP